MFPLTETRGQWRKLTLLLFHPDVFYFLYVCNFHIVAFVPSNSNENSKFFIFALVQLFHQQTAMHSCVKLFPLFPRAFFFSDFARDVENAETGGAIDQSRGNDPWMVGGWVEIANATETFCHIDYQIDHLCTCRTKSSSQKSAGNKEY